MRSPAERSLQQSWRMLCTHYRAGPNSASNATPNSASNTASNSAPNTASNLTSNMHSHSDRNLRLPSLAFVERTGLWSWCVRPGQVDAVLSHYHDSHGQFSEDITQRRLIGAYYWPTRMRDTVEFCRSCESCQFFDPQKPAQTILPMLHLQPMDMLGMDYLGPITPIPESGNRYTLVIVDYFSRHCWARAVKANSGVEAVRAITDLSRTFGWPLSLYTDNGTHFAQGPLPILMELRIRHFPAPKTHPQPVGLSERMPS